MNGDEQIAFRYRRQPPQNGRQPQAGAVGLTNATRQPVSRTRQPVQHLEGRASTHRAGHYAGLHPEDTPYMTQEQLRGQVTYTVDEAELAGYEQPPRPHTSIARYDLPEVTTQGNTYYYPDQVIKRRRSAQPSPQDQQPTQNVPSAKPQRRFHWLFFVGIGMTVAFILWIGGGYALSWFASWKDDIEYGTPRTFQIDYVVGHNDSPQNPTHFIALNLNDQIVIEEFPGGNISKAKIYSGPMLYGQGGGLTPVTLSFQDVSQNGHPEMIVHFQDSEIIYLNKIVNGVWVFVPQQKQGVTS